MTFFADLDPKGILWYYPNVIGYIRIALSVLVALFPIAFAPWVIATLYGFASLLDMLDGVLARMMNQCSRFGEVLDVVSDILCRGAMWTAAAATSQCPPALALGVVCLEWTTFASTHAGSLVKSEHWKSDAVPQPRIVAATFRNGFKNPLGVFVLGSIFLLPLALFLRPVIGPVADAAVAFLAVGRVVGAVVEGWLCLQHAGALLRLPPSSPPRAAE